MTPLLRKSRPTLEAFTTAFRQRFQVPDEAVSIRRSHHPEASPRPDWIAAWRQPRTLEVFLESFGLPFFPIIVDLCRDDLEGGQVDEEFVEEVRVVLQQGEDLSVDGTGTQTDPADRHRHSTAATERPARGIHGRGLCPACRSSIR